MSIYQVKLTRYLIAAIIVTFLPLLLNAQSLVQEGEEPETIASGFQFTEGPFWHWEGYLLFSDIPANTIYKWKPESSESVEFMNPSGHSNGITSDSDGNIILAQHDGMISRITPENDVVVLVRSYDGKRLNSPNDVVVKSDGAIYFTDPPFGVGEEEQELSFSGVYRWKDNQLTMLFDGFDRPNGIVFSPDEQYLYVNNTTSGEIMSFEVSDSGELQNERKFAEVGEAAENGAADGMTVDTEGRIYSTGPGGIYIFAPDGQQVEMIDLPERATNLAWGGENNNLLFITTPSAVYRLAMNTEGLK